MIKVALIATVSLGVAAACGADGESSANRTPDTNAPPAASGTPYTQIIRCGTAPSPTCPPFGLPVTLEVQSSYLANFTPPAGNRVVALSGERVNFTLRGFWPDEQVRLFSTDDTYDGASYRIESDGTLELPVFVSSNAEPGEDYYVAVQEPEDGSQVIVALFIIATLDRDTAAARQREIVGEVLEAIGLGD